MASVATPAAFSRSLPLLVAAAVLLNFIDRGSVGIAAPLMKQELGLTATEFGVAVSAFFWVYAPIQLVIGWLCDRYCVYRLYAAGMVLCAISTSLTGLVGGLASMVALRLLLGMGESITFPGGSKIIARHVPSHRRGIANGLVGAALALGPAVGTLAGGVIMAAYGWRAMFVVFGLVTLIWLAPWLLTTRHLVVRSQAMRETSFPVSKLLRFPALWAMGVGHFLDNYVLYFVLTWLPLYLVQSRGFSIANMTLLVTIVYAVQASSALATGWSSDCLVSIGREEGAVRKMMMAFGAAGLAVSIFGAVSASSSFGVSAWLIAAGVFQGFKVPNNLALAQMFAGPRSAGTWYGVQNTMGNFAGILGPVITGMIIDRTGSYTYAFITTSAAAAVAAVWWVAGVPKVRQIELD